MNTGLSKEEITVRMHRAMDAATELPLDDSDEIETLIQVGERLVAFELLCTQLYEYDIRLDSGIVQQLVEVGKSLGSQDKYISWITWQ